MYRVTDEQVDFILADIKSRGIELEDLQQNLLDHICCILEERLSDDSDFRVVYHEVIRDFFKTSLRELEDETINLLTFKNYFIMKKFMIVSGILAVTALSLGVLFKFLHFPGAAVLLTLGIASFSLIFLPLLFTLKAKEKPASKDRLLAGLAIFSGMMMSMAILFKVMHWPGAMIMLYLALALLLFVLLPVYLLHGLKNPDTRVNTIVTSVMLVAFCALWLTMITSPQSVRREMVANTFSFLMNQKILEAEKRHSSGTTLYPTAETDSLGLRINEVCDELKKKILIETSGSERVEGDFESKNTLIRDGWLNLYDSDYEMIINLRELVDEYNESGTEPGFQSIPISSGLLEFRQVRAMNALNNLFQIQMIVLQNRKETERE